MSNVIRKNNHMNFIETLNHNPYITKIFCLKNALILLALLFLLVFLIAPIVAIFLDAFAKGYGLFFSTLFSENVMNALFLSIMITLGATIAAIIFGIAAAWTITHFNFYGKRLMISLIDLPISISPIIIGLMFMVVYGKYTWFGSSLEDLGFKVIFSWPGLLLTNMAITLPFIARSLIPAMRSLGNQQEMAALMLGAKFHHIFFKVTLPNIRWALMYGIILAMARSVGEFGAASVVSGFIRLKTVTLPLQVNIFYSEYLSTQAYVSATLFVLLSLVTLFLKKYVQGKTVI